ncbi:4821_t:CDS:1 [Dentiscutata erythropus]|uniref:4821_t:CDS:1 n=1 Tax=Dentiscutata erythropus TaxID=1348616 RepID=A0A9N9G3D9_9GLOM|nr:4821_t:CDS:1 [Dentiscutata erythropus]
MNDTIKSSTDVDPITRINIFDFDGTLFASPQPNHELWEDPLFGYLKSDSMIFKGWYQHRKSLIFDESVRRRRWKGWWNDEMVDLVRDSVKHPNSLTVLLTGRGYSEFNHIIMDMVERKGLKFDVMGLKPDQNTIEWNLCYKSSIIQKVGDRKYEELIRNETILFKADMTEDLEEPNNSSRSSRKKNIINRVTTKEFKLIFIRDLLQHHPSAKSIRLWDDRAHHVKCFQSFFDDLILRGKVQKAIANTVFLPIRYFDPYYEYLVVQAMVDDHNKEVERFSRMQANESSRKFSLGKIQLVQRQYYLNGYIFTKFAIVNL